MCLRAEVHILWVILHFLMLSKGMMAQINHKSEYDIKVLASGLGFPEGPIAIADGSVLFVEMANGSLSKVDVEGNVSVVAKLGGGPNGAALGPDGAVYVCNNGGLQWFKRDEILIPGEAAPEYKGGYIQRVEIATGEVEKIYTQCNGRNLSAPNDIVFDETGGMWFSDQGKYFSTYKDHGAIYYAMPDGSFISLQAEKLDTPNGIRLSEDGKTLFYAETSTGRIWSYKIPKPGQLDLSSKKLVIGLAGHQLFDSFALEDSGNICAAVLINGGISVISPDGMVIKHIETNDNLTTSICFGGANMQTAYITLGGTGKLISIPWDASGLRLNFGKIH